MRLSLRGMAENWRLKLAALALAVLLWAVVSAEQVTTQWIPVRVEPVLRDPGYVMLGGPDPAEVRVRFRGPGRELWQLAFGRPTLVLQVQDVGGARRFVLDPTMVANLPERIRALDVRPAVVHLELERLTTREVPVRAQIGERSLERFVLADSVRITPPTVRLTGPEAALGRIDAVVTRPFEIVPDPNDSSFARRIGLDTAGLEEGVTLSRPEVRVSGAIDPREERVVPRVPVWTPQGVAAAPAEVEVRVQGGRRALVGFSPTTLRAVVPPDSLPSPLPAVGAEASVRVEGLPPNTVGRVVPARVRVTPAVSVPPPPAAPPAPGASPAPPPPR